MSDENIERNYQEDDSYRNELLEQLFKAQEKHNSLLLIDEQNKKRGNTFNIETQIKESVEEISVIIAKLMIENSKHEIAQNEFDRQQRIKQNYEDEQKILKEVAEKKKRKDKLLKKVKESVSPAIEKKGTELIIKDVNTWIANHTQMTHKFLTESFTKDREMFDRHLQKTREMLAEEKVVPIRANINEQDFDNEYETIEETDDDILLLLAPLLEVKLSIVQRIKNWFKSLWN